MYHVVIHEKQTHLVASRRQVHVMLLYTIAALFNIMEMTKIPFMWKRYLCISVIVSQRGGELHQYCNIEILLLMVCRADPWAQCLLEFLY